MALEVEDGTAKANAEAYASVTAADTYMADRGYKLWATMTTPEKEQALRRATDYMVGMYRLRWAGYRKTTTQALDWPRYEVPILDSAVEGTYAAFYSDTTVPTAVVRACVELAYRAAAGELAPDLEAPVTSEQVGPISVTYAEGARQSVLYRAVTAMLAPFLVASGGMLKVSRA